MAQHDQNIGNDTSANVRADINAALAALFSSSSGSSAPATTIAYQIWADTTNGLLKIRNATNSAWIVLGALDASSFRFLPAAGSASTPAYATDGDVNTGMHFPAADTVAFVVGGNEALRLNNARQAEHPPGSATVPAVTTTGDLNTGFFFPAADTVAVTTAGAERGRVTSGGQWLWNSSSAVYAGTRASFWANSAGQAAIEAVNTSNTGNALIARINDAACNFVYFDLAGVQVGSITTNGSATFYNTSSDARLKTAIVDLPGAGAIIDAIRPRIFQWRATGALDVGFVAQELAAIVPGAVHVGSAGDLEPAPDGTLSGVWSVDASRLMPYVIAELKGLRARVAVLERA